MARAKAPPRVKGPYSERGGSRFRIRICDSTGHRDLYFFTLDEAQASIKQAERELSQSSNGRQLGNILDEYTNDRIQRGLCGAQSARDERGRLRGWFAGSLHDDISKLTAKRAAGCYEQLIATPTRKTGQPPTAATHRFYLNLAKRLFRWAVRKGYLRTSPFAEIQPVGRPNRGKKQLRFEEAERFITAGFRLFDEKGDAMALASVTALLLGCRASEVLHLHVRDLECGGTRLWIAAQGSEYQGKTTNAARNPEVPEVLRPRLLQRAAGKLSEEYLFGVTAGGRPKPRQLLHSAVRRVCLAAGVPVVSPTARSTKPPASPTALLWHRLKAPCSSSSRCLEAMCWERRACASESAPTEELVANRSSSDSGACDLCQSPPPWDHPSPRIRDQGKTSRNRNGIYTPS